MYEYTLGVNAKVHCVVGLSVATTHTTPVHLLVSVFNAPLVYRPLRLPFVFDFKCGDLLSS